MDARPQVIPDQPQLGEIISEKSSWAASVGHPDPLSNFGIYSSLFPIDTSFSQYIVPSEAAVSE